MYNIKQYNVLFSNWLQKDKTYVSITYFRYIGNFGHSPKYYLPISGVNCFAKIFSIKILYCVVCSYIPIIHNLCYVYMKSTFDQNFLVLICVDISAHLICVNYLLDHKSCFLLLKYSPVKFDSSYLCK